MGGKRRKKKATISTPDAVPDTVPDAVPDAVPAFEKEILSEEVLCELDELFQLYNTGDAELDELIDIMIADAAAAPDAE